MVLHDDLLTEFIRSVYYKSVWNRALQITEKNSVILFRYIIANCRERRVVIVESVITPSRIRHLLADIILKQFEVCVHRLTLVSRMIFFFQASSLAFIPSHLGATYTLGRTTALVLDVGYKEAQVMPVAEGVPLAVKFDSLPYASQAIHK